MLANHQQKAHTMATKSTTAPSAPSAPSIDAVLNAWAASDPSMRDAQTAASAARLKAASPAAIVTTVALPNDEFVRDSLAHDAAIVSADKACTRTLRKALADRVKVPATRAGEQLAARMLGMAR